MDPILDILHAKLAVISVVTVMGYAIFRYVKVKAVGYDTMK